MHILTIVGARPQFIKAAVLSRLIRSGTYAHRIRETLVHTGQHYDDNMSEVFFREMCIPQPDLNLGIGSGSHGRMTGEMLAAIEATLLQRKPDLVLVYGDTNSTLAGALAASKLQLPLIHVEAGLRSYDKRMPEEQNRVLTDHLSTWLICPTAQALANLEAEGLRSHGGPRPTSDRPWVVNCGDVMYDAALFYQAQALRRPDLDRLFPGLALPSRFRLLTLHRAENIDDPRRLKAIFRALAQLPELPILFPVHPRTRKGLAAAGIPLPPHIRAIDPVGYLDMLELEVRCEQVLTDSGGVQKEAYFFARPCLTLRDQTEWVETLESGWNRVVGADEEAILEAARAPVPMVRPRSPFGDGKAGSRILDLVLEGCPVPEVAL